ncbi:MAG: hypothetical protein Q8L81_01780 [Bacteroidota bacterium]|nr:hypothetical protein [Bacteroidota bacterium]
MKKIVFILSLAILFSCLPAFAIVGSQKTSDKLFISPDSLCDLVIMKNGDEVKARVLEITPIEIKYKKCLSPDGPLYVVKKNDVFMIKYANGTKEVMKVDNPMSDNNTTGDEAKKTKEEQEHIRQCEANSRSAHRIVFILGGLILAFYASMFILSAR